MRRRGTIWVLFLLLAAVALFALGCSDNGGTTTTTGGTTSTTAATGALPDLTGQSMEVAAVWTGDEQANFQQVIDLFVEKTGAKVQYTSTGDDIATVLGTRIQGGNPPDVALLPQPGLMTQLVQQDALKPIGDVLGDAMQQNYEPVWAELGMVDGQQYGLVFKAANKSTVWYNVQALTDAGVEPPKTWVEFLAAADTLQASGVPAFAIAGADGWTLTDWFENVYLRTAGPEKYDQLTKHEIPWTDASVTTALTELAKVFGATDLIAGGQQGALQTDFPTSVSQVYTVPPGAAMVYEGDFVAGNITGETQAKIGTDANFFAFPSINDSPDTVVAGGDTAVLMKDSEAGKAFIQFLATPEAAEVWVAQGGFDSPNKNVDITKYPDEVSGRAAEALATAQVVRFDMSDLAPAAFGGTPAQGEWKILQDFLRDSSNVDQTAQQLEDAAAAAYTAAGTTTTTAAGEATTTTSG